MIEKYKTDKTGYGFRMTALKSMAAVMQYTEDKSQIYTHLIQAFKDDIPNVNICAAKICIEQRHLIDQNTWSNEFVKALKEMIQPNGVD